MSDIQPLDPYTLPLQGARLIEASAGTGKTFTLAALYLRLLLGIGCDRSYDVKHILLVTFTEAATRELRERVRANIHAMRLACLRGDSKHPVCQRLLQDIAEPLHAAQLLLYAERQMDEAAIFTIHGFCQQMLTLNAFESGMSFAQKITEDESGLRQLVSADFWRRCCYPLSTPLAQLVQQRFQQPQDLLKKISPFLRVQLPRILPELSVSQSLQQHYSQTIAQLDSLKSLWRKHSTEIIGLILHSGVNKNSYKSNNLQKWFQQVDGWVNNKQDYLPLPDSLKWFSQQTLTEKTKNEAVPRHPLFAEIDKILAPDISITDLLLIHALHDIYNALAAEKQRRGETGFDDMLSRLDQALNPPAATSHQILSGAERLAQAIRQQFPVAMIDEFQDTDPLQYRIFRRLWYEQPGCALLLIGDPKQAIYAFRGADIFTYMQARQQISNHYTLGINWRSSPAMVASVNQLFSRLDTPFLYQAISFNVVQAAAKNQSLRFSWRGETQPAMRFWLLDTPVTKQDYQQQLANVCAGQIRDWLIAGAQGDALLHHTNGARALSAGDITVLVRNYSEATLIKNALNNLNIPSVYLSGRDSVFSSPTARELLWLLHAVLAPEQKNLVRRAISSNLLGLDAASIDGMNHDETAWDRLTERLLYCQQLWRCHGVIPMLHQFTTQYQIAENLLQTPGGERQLTDLLHLGELLQQAAGTLDSQYGLVRWLERQIHTPNGELASQQLRLESDRHLVQIATIHKAKGLEYPLVCLPFIAAYQPAKHCLFHQPDTFDTIWDLSGNEQHQQLAEQERLAEDLRLLYVALTRAIWHCSIGIAPIMDRKGKNSLHHSAPGWLLQRGETLDSEQLRNCLQEFCQHSNNSVSWLEAAAPGTHCWQPPPPPEIALAAKTVTRWFDDHWRVTSYSGLQYASQQAQDNRSQAGQPLTDLLASDNGLSDQQLSLLSQSASSNQLPALELLNMDLEATSLSAPGPSGSGLLSASTTETLSIHHLPRGASIGTFLHNMLQHMDFTAPLNAESITEQLQLVGLAADWQPVLYQWLQQLLTTPLTDNGMTLKQLANRDKLCELAFWLPVQRNLTPMALDNVTHCYDPLSATCPPLKFHALHGMLKGFIDLVFRWQGRYYLLDYKSNWLGDNSAAYNQPALQQAMRQHRYDLQYQLYSLALHRYLRHRQQDYHYSRHFGGIIYLFLRGIDSGTSNGIFHTCPSAELIDKLDSLFDAPA